MNHHSLSDIYVGIELRGQLECWYRWTQIDCELILKRNGRNLENMLKCLQIEAKIFWLVEDSKVIFILFIVIILPNIQLSRHQETKLQSLSKTTPQQLINLINLLPFWNQFNQTELMFSPLVVPSFPQALYTLWKTYKQARVFSSKIRLQIPVACHLTVRCKWTTLTFHNQGWHTLPLVLIISVSPLNLGVLC